MGTITPIFYKTEDSNLLCGKVVEKAIDVKFILTISKKRTRRVLESIVVPQVTLTSYWPVSPLHFKQQ